jgi:RNA polymerase sigma-70 factor (ECF subfamily)
MVTALIEALAALSPEHRSIVVLREFHGLEYEEIATALDLEVGTVRSRLHRSRESLRQALEQRPRPERGDR